MRNYIASEDIKSARDVIGYRIEVVQLWTPEVQRLANAAASDGPGAGD